MRQFFKVFLFEDLPPADRRADDVYLAHYIERAGTGTLDMIRLCREAVLPEPEFRHEGERFVVVVWRDWLTDAVMAGLGLNERQRKGAAYLKRNGAITNHEYQNETGAIVRTAARDLKKLVEIGLLRQVGATGRNTRYILVDKRDTNETKPLEEDLP